MIAKIDKKKIGNHPLVKGILRGRDYIKNFQNKEGYWTDFNSPVTGQSTQWVTGYIGYFLSRVEKSFSNEASYLGKAVDWLLNTERKEGGWGYKIEYFADADSTANVIRLLACGHERIRIERLEKLGDFLLSFLHKATGGVRTYRPLPIFLAKSYMSRMSGWCKPEIAVSAMVGLALLMINKGRYKDTLDKIKDFLLKSQTFDGFWESYWWDGRIYGTSICCEFLEKLGERNDVEKIVNWMLSQQTNEGGWGNCYDENTDPFNTALALAALGCSKENPRCFRAIENGIEWLLKNQALDGGWEASAAVREPEPFVYFPWKEEYRSKTVVIKDQNRLFTSAAVIGTLSIYLQEINAKNK